MEGGGARRTFRQTSSKPPAGLCTAGSADPMQTAPQRRILVSRPTQNPKSKVRVRVRVEMKSVRDDALPIHPWCWIGQSLQQASHPPYTTNSQPEATKKLGSKMMNRRPALMQDRDREPRLKRTAMELADEDQGKGGGRTSDFMRRDEIQRVSAAFGAVPLVPALRAGCSCVQVRGRPRPRRAERGSPVLFRRGLDIESQTTTADRNQPTPLCTMSSSVFRPEIPLGHGQRVQLSNGPLGRRFWQVLSLVPRAWPAGIHKSWYAGPIVIRLGLQARRLSLVGSLGAKVRNEQTLKNAMSHRKRKQREAESTTYACGGQDLTWFGSRQNAGRNNL